MSAPPMSPWSIESLLGNIYIHWVFISCVAYLLIYLVLSPWISSKFVPKYNQFSKYQKVDWDSRTNSNINAIITTSLCIYLFLSPSHNIPMSENPVWYDSYLVRIEVALLVGYTIADSIIMFFNWGHIGEVGYIFHHGSAIFAYSFVVVEGVFCYYSNWRVIAELSTPFINLRWYLDVLGIPKTSRIFVANGLVMMFTFFLCRIAVMPAYYYTIFRWLGTDLWNSAGNIQYVLITTCIILDVVNIFWMAKIVRGALKVLGYNIGGGRKKQAQKSGMEMDKLEQKPDLGVGDKNGNDVQRMSTLENIRHRVAAGIRGER